MHFQTIKNGQIGSFSRLVMAGSDVLTGHAGASAAENLDLFEAGNDARMPLPEPVGAGEPRKAGRPVGARNRRTNEVADYYLGRYGDPLEALLRLGMRPIADIVRELQAVARGTSVPLLGKNQSLVNLIGIQTAALTDALPYLRQRMPLAVDVTDKPRDVLIVGDITAPMRAAMASLGIDPDSVRAPKPQTLELQALSEGDGAAIPLDAFPIVGQGTDNAG
jgi:hypothetical protein